MSTGKAQSFAAGAATLMLASAAVKVIGALFKIPLTRLLGGEGMGFYMTAFSLFGPVLALSVSGFSVAVAKLTAAAHARGGGLQAQRILTVALLVFPLFGLLGSAGLYLLAPYFTTLVGNTGALQAVRAIAPAVLFCCLGAVLRGYYEGGRNMVPTAVSQLVEALTKLAAGLLLAQRSMAQALRQFEAGGHVYGVAVQTRQQALIAAAPWTSAAAVGGVTIACAAGFAALVLRYALGGRKAAPAARRHDDFSFCKTVGALLGVAAPVCLGALVISLAPVIDLVTVMNRVAVAAQRDWPALCQSQPGAGLEQLGAARAANFLFGAYTGLALTVFHLVPSFAAALGTCALPMVSALAARGGSPLLGERVESVLRVTVLLAAPLGMGMACMAQPLLAAVFPNNPAEVAVAARLLPWLGGAAVFSALAGCANSMLQAVGELLAPVRLMLFGAVLKLVANALLIGLPQVNIVGVGVGALLCYGYIAAAAVALLCRRAGLKQGLLGLLLRPVLASACCCVAAVGVYRALPATFSQRLACGGAVACGGCVYLMAVVLLGAVRPQDLYLLGKDAKMRKLLLLCCKSPCKLRNNAVK